MSNPSQTQLCECCGATGATLLCYWPAWLCPECGKTLAAQGDKGERQLLAARNARARLAGPKPTELATGHDDADQAAESVECTVTGGETTYRWKRGHVCTHYMFVGTRPGVSRFAELIEITDHLDTIRDGFGPNTSHEGFTGLFVVEPGESLPFDVVSVAETHWMTIEFDPDEWMLNWGMRHDLAAGMLERTFQALYEVSTEEGQRIQKLLQEAEVGR